MTSSLAISLKAGAVPTRKIRFHEAQCVDIARFVRIFARTMRRRLLPLAALLPAALIFAADSREPRKFTYPPAPSSGQIDEYSGVKVADPYRPLENTDAPESRK